MARPSPLASRVVSQYRSRDVFAYLSLRYFLESDLASTDQFIRKNVPQIVRGYNSSAYLESLIFKEFGDDGQVIHRDFYVPSAAEALAEAVLLEEVSQSASVPDREVCFSYWVGQSRSRKNIYEPYMKGLKARQATIGRYIEANENTYVQYLDIKKFYPSLNLELLGAEWTKFCHGQNVSNWATRLGSKLIEKQRLSSENGGMLVGPMFSHFLANVAMREIDQRLRSLPCLALRYVDDFVLVGSRREISDASLALKNWLSELGLELHSTEDEKSFSVGGNEWLTGLEDFEAGPISEAWMRLVGDIKKVLILDIEDGGRLADVLHSEGFRIPIADYSSANLEASTFEKIRELGIWGWLFKRAYGVNSESIVRDALRLRELVEAQILDLTSKPRRLDTFAQKRLATKLRYRLGRALYLSEENFLSEARNRISDWPELAVHHAIAGALVSKKCDDVISLGTNVAQSTAQLFRASLETAIFEKSISQPAEQLGVSIFILNGVPVRASEVNDSLALRLANGPLDVPMFRETTGFFKELACLHGLGEARHSKVFNEAFDISNDINFDAISFEYGYSI